MAGVLILLCDWIYETVWHIIAFLAFGTWIPGLAMCIAFIFEGYYKYNKGSCTTGKLLPSIALPRLLFFPMWLIMWEVLALAGWVIWYFHGRWCESFIPLFIWFGTFIVTALWPIMMFVTQSFLLSFLVFAFSTIWVVALIGATVVFAFDVVAIIGEVIFLIWVAYNAVWTFIAWRNKGFRFPSPREVLQDVTGVLSGNNSSSSQLPSGGQGQFGQSQFGQGQAQFGSGVPSPCSGGYGGGPLSSQCPTSGFVGTEMTTSPPGTERSWQL